MDNVAAGRQSIFWVAMALIFLAIFLYAPKLAHGATIEYEHSIQNGIFNVSCIACHGKYGVAIKKVNLTNYDEVVSHPYLVLPGDPDNSRIVQKVESRHGGLTSSEINDLRIWILQGANGD